MPKLHNPHTVKMRAAELLASNASQIETAKACGVSRSTIVRWLASTDFQYEVDRRKALLNDQIDQAALKLQQAQADKFLEELQDYRAAKVGIHKTYLSTGSKLLKKITERVNDLPSEAIAPSQIAGLLSAANSLCNDGLSGWGDVIAIDELLKRLQERLGEDSTTSQ